ncbi:LysR family transcriptional regulator [Terasakiella pusilla]|uniref:LysR family transcriptional regulator n=1 Tax=Terasakiella pusilla TaxID=64973 RepID=UPI003AA8BD45
MEARQLCYFLIACQQPNHATAAKELGIAPSTLSTSLNLLEEELAIKLFHRTQQGFHPTKEARWLYSNAEIILRAIESAQSYIPNYKDAPLNEITITSSLKFFLGRLSKALSAAIGEVQSQYMDVLFSVNFQFGLQSALGLRTLQTNVSETDQTIHIEYKSPDLEDGYEELPIFEDQWVVVSNEMLCAPTGQEFSILSIDNMRALDLTLPRLPDNLMADALNYCKENGLGVPSNSEEDIGSLPRLCQSVEAFAFLIPASTLSSRLGQRKLYRYELETPLISQLMARIASDHPAAKSLVKAFSSRILNMEESHVFNPLISLRQIHYFTYVYEARNISLAAKRLRVAQPALSSQIKKLETNLGVQLFSRQRGGLDITPEGHIFASYVNVINEARERIRRDVVAISAQRQSRLRIGMIPIIDNDSPIVRAMAKTLCKWKSMYPNVNVQVLEGPNDLLQDWILDGTVHLALVETAPVQGGRIKLNGAEELGLVSHPEYQGVTGDHIPASALAGVKLVLPTPVFGIRRIIDGDLASAVNLDIAMEVNSLATVIGLVRTSEYATILPLAAVERYVEQGILKFTPISGMSIFRNTYMTYSNERELTVMERDFISILRDKLDISAA